MGVGMATTNERWRWHDSAIAGDACECTGLPRHWNDALGMDDDFRPAQISDRFFLLHLVQAPACSKCIAAVGIDQIL